MTTIGIFCLATGGTGLLVTGTSVICQAVPLAGDMPWDKLAAGGAALLVTSILVYVLKQQREQHKECNATIERVTGTFAKTVDDCTEKFNTTTTTLLDKARESHERREEKLHEMLRDRSART